jgi:ABC-type phosphate transport system substrate-binding protein
LLCCLAALCCAAHAKQFAVITDISNPASDLTTGELTKIFNAHTQTWPDGRAVKVVVHDLSSPDMRVVLRKLMAMSPEQAGSFVQTHSRTIVIAESDEAVVKLVAGTRGAIGIVDLFSITKDVKVLKIDGKLPVEPGYVLRGNTQ